MFFLRLNPLTSSDVVSYGAGLTGVLVWKVALGTLAGMAPLCYAQAYLADRIFRLLPGSIWILVPLGDLVRHQTNRSVSNTDHRHRRPSLAR